MFADVQREASAEEKMLEFECLSSLSWMLFQCRYGIESDCPASKRRTMLEYMLVNEFE